MGVPVYPTSVKSFTTKQDGIDTVVASHVNTLQDEVVGLQNFVGVTSELPSLNLPSLSGTGSSVASRVGPQINGLKQWTDFLNTYKAPLASPTFTGTVTLPSTTSIGTVTNTELGYLDGVTSAIQTQINTKMPYSGGIFTGNVTFNTGLWTNDIYTQTFGNLRLNANGGVVEARNGGSLTRVMCSVPLSGDDAVNLNYLNNAFGLVVSQAYAKRPSGWSPTWGADEMAVVSGQANQRFEMSINGGYPFIAGVTNTGAVNLFQYLLVSSTPASSRTVKDDIRELTEEEVSAFDMIEPQAFVLKENGEFHFGFIAEDVQEAGIPVPSVPGRLPTSTSDEVPVVPGLYERDLIAILWAQVKKQQRQIEVLTEQISPS